jgi:hypothetical protein
MRRSSPPYKALRSKAVGWNVGERKPNKAEGDCGFSNPEGANSACSAYRLLNDVPCPFYTLSQPILLPTILKKTLFE